VIALRASPASHARQSNMPEARTLVANCPLLLFCRADCWPLTAALTAVLGADMPPHLIACRDLERKNKKRRTFLEEPLRFWDAEMGGQVFQRVGGLAGGFAGDRDVLL
jgi:hypothetical protein